VTVGVRERLEEGLAFEQKKRTSRSGQIPAVLMHTQPSVASAVTENPRAVRIATEAWSEMRRHCESTTAARGHPVRKGHVTVPSAVNDA
jgi:hypothetical protein